MTGPVQKPKLGARIFVMGMCVLNGAFLSLGVMYLVRPVALAIVGLIPLAWGGAFTYLLRFTRSLHAAERHGCTMLGLGLPLLLLAHFNRSGPGWVCDGEGVFYDCFNALDPMPWLLAGLIFVIAGAILFIRGATRRVSSPAPTAG